MNTKEPLIERLLVSATWSTPHSRLLVEAAEEIQRLQREMHKLKTTWIEPKPVTRQSKSQGSTQRWPFMIPHNHEAQAVTGISIPETPA